MNDTTNTWKATLSLRDIEPSEDNPRQDFGDIAALADRIRATGGQPINPIVCVRDGEAYRIVDGERRYRALLEIYGDAGRTTALVFSDYSDAHAAVAMLATDDKKPLSRREQARGFQTMMRLDVPMADVVHATGIGADELHRARRSLAAASRMADGAQATMDALIAAGADEFSEEERDKILASEWPESEAADIVKSHRRADRLASIRLAMPDGIEFAERGASTDGLLYVTEVKTAKAARELELEDGRDYVAIPPRYELGAPVWTVYERRYGDDDIPSEAEVRRARAAEKEAERDGLLRHMRTHMMSWLLNNIGEDALQPIADIARGKRAKLPRLSYDLSDEDASLVDSIENAIATCSELTLWLNSRVERATPEAWNSWYYGNDAMIVETWDLLVACGWEPDELDQKVRDACKA